jgi:hypothetical protein
MLATYSGSKAFITTFSAALGEEVKKHGIIVENVNTYFVVCVDLFQVFSMLTLSLRSRSCLKSASRLCSSHSQAHMSVRFCPKLALHVELHTAVVPTRPHHIGRMLYWTMPSTFSTPRVCSSDTRTTCTRTFDDGHFESRSVMPRHNRLFPYM